MNTSKIKVFLIILLAIILLSLVYVQVTLFSDLQYQKTLETLQKIDKNAVSLNEQVLKVNQGLLRNYDALAITVDTMISDLEIISLNKQKLYQQESNELKQLKQKIIKLNQTIEYFLAANALLNNSLLYLPVVLNELAPGTQNHGKTSRWAHQLIEQTFIYNRWHEAENKTNIETLIDKLMASSLSVSPENAALLSTIIAHAQIINESSDLISDQINIIFSTHIDHDITVIRQKYNKNHFIKNKQAEHLNWVIYTIACILLLLIFDFIFAQRAIAWSLHSSNKHLRQEMKQRIKAESKQKAEALFLQTLP